MTSSPIPAHPLPLSAAEADVLRQRQLKKHDVAIILLHWFNAITWLLELLTGLALITSPKFRLAPQWYVDLVQGVFGSRAGLIRFHIVAGLVWMIVYLVYGVFGFRTYLSREVLKKEIALDEDDFRWLIVRTLRILGRSKDPLPPQGIYNAGQKLFALMVYAMIPLVMVSGVVMAFRLFGPAAVGWAIVLHYVGVGTIVSGLMIHVYMGAVFPEEKPAFFSMITGTVDELYAYRHHYKWWAEVKAAQQAHALRHAPPPAAGDTPSAPDAVPGTPGGNAPA